MKKYKPRSWKKPFRPKEVRKAHRKEVKAWRLQKKKQGLVERRIKGRVRWAKRIRKESD